MGLSWALTLTQSGNKDAKNTMFTSSQKMSFQNRQISVTLDAATVSPSNLDENCHLSVIDLPSGEARGWSWGA